MHQCRVRALLVKTDVLDETALPAVHATPSHSHTRGSLAGAQSHRRQSLRQFRLRAHGHIWALLPTSLPARVVAGWCRQATARAAHVRGQRSGWLGMTRGATTAEAHWRREGTPGRPGSGRSVARHGRAPASCLRASACSMLRGGVNHFYAPDSGLRAGRGSLGSDARAGTAPRSAPLPSGEHGKVQAHPLIARRLAPPVRHAGMRRIRGVADALSTSALAWRPVGKAETRRKAQGPRLEPADARLLRQQRVAAKRVKQTLREMEARFPLPGRSTLGPRLTADRLRALAAPRAVPASRSSSGGRGVPPD